MAYNYVGGHHHGGPVDMAVPLATIDPLISLVSTEQIKEEESLVAAAVVGAEPVDLDRHRDRPLETPMVESDALFICEL